MLRDVTARTGQTHIHTDRQTRPNTLPQSHLGVVKITPTSKSLVENSTTTVGKLNGDSLAKDTFALKSCRSPLLPARTLSINTDNCIDPDDNKVNCS